MVKVSKWDILILNGLNRCRPFLVLAFHLPSTSNKSWKMGKKTSKKVENFYFSQEFCSYVHTFCPFRPWFCMKCRDAHTVFLFDWPRYFSYLRAKFSPFFRNFYFFRPIFAPKSLKKETILIQGVKSILVNQEEKWCVPCGALCRVGVQTDKMCGNESKIPSTSQTF